jgi:hypothetical protein
MKWHELCAERLLLLGHVASSFTCTVSPTTTFNPLANFVSTANLTPDCPLSLLTAPADNHPDQEVWLQSYYGKNHSIESLGTVEKLSLAQYRAFCEKGALEAVLTMCVLTINPD